MTGKGDTRYGDHQQMRMISINRLVYPGWWKNKLFIGLGISKVSQNQPLVGEWNYRPIFGYDGGVYKVYYHHYSSAGVNDMNTGVDGIVLRVEM